MALRVRISDPDDDRVDDFRDLARADRRPDRPGGRGLVIAEGTVVVRRLLASAYPVRALLGIERRIGDLADVLEPVDAPAYVADAQTMAEVVGFHLNRGVLAVADRTAPLSISQLAAGGGTLVVTEGIGDHENLGALFRNAAAFGISGVVIGPGCSDPLYRRSVRVSMGNVLRVPFATVTEEENLTGALATMRAHGYRIAALTPRTGSMALPELQSLASDPVAVLLGSEGHGLSAAALAAADAAVRIPMAEGVDSLNVATAAAVAFYELTRAGLAAPATALPIADSSMPVK